MKALQMHFICVDFRLCGKFECIVAWDVMKSRLRSGKGKISVIGERELAIIKQHRNVAMIVVKMLMWTREKSANKDRRAEEREGYIREGSWWSCEQRRFERESVDLWACVCLLLAIGPHLDGLKLLYIYIYSIYRLYALKSIFNYQKTSYLWLVMSSKTNLTPYAVLWHTASPSQPKPCSHLTLKQYCISVYHWCSDIKGNMIPVCSY